MKLLKAFLRLAAVLTGIVLVFVLVVWLFEYRPENREVIYRAAHARSLLTDTLTLLTWNTGYAGLDDSMDFFYDGGKQSRTNAKRATENLERIASFLQHCGADIILLQEVDVFSKRSYYTDQFETYRKRLSDYRAFFAYNYNSLYVPVPLKQPMGRVKGGIALFSRPEPLEVLRYQYPSRFSFPMRLFNLKRCLLSARYRMLNGRTLTVSNTHNTAYDTGGMRTQEMNYLRDTLTAEYARGILSITGGDWNQNPPDYLPSDDENGNRYFSPLRMDSTLFPAGWEFVYDRSRPTARYLDEPYNPATTTTTLIDLFLISPGIRCIDIRTIDLGFRHSDHNPVRAVFVIG